MTLNSRFSTIPYPPPKKKTHLQTAIPNLLLIKPALLQMLYELRVIPLESCQQIRDELAPAVLKLLKLLNAAKQRISIVAHNSEQIRGHLQTSVA